MIEYRSIQDFCDEIKNYCLEIKRLKQEQEICERNIEARKQEQEICERNIKARKQELENLDRKIFLRKQELDRLQNEAEREIEQKKQAAYEQMQKSLAYQQRREEEARYLEEVRSDIRRREKFEDGLCDEMRQVSGSFHGGMQDLIRELKENMDRVVEKLQQETEEAVAAMEKQTANAINAVVDTERRIRKDDFGDLLHNFAELQQLVFYNTPEGELGLEVTRVERYLKRFLKVLNRLGYEEYVPQPGEDYDEYLHIAAEREEEELPEKLDGYVVDGIVSYGFKKEDEICMLAKVTVAASPECGKTAADSMEADKKVESEERR